MTNTTTGTEEMKVTIGELFTKQYSDKEPGIPVLEIHSLRIRGEEEKAHTYYLTPFRGYGFQVSGTKDGEGSFGRSAFIGLKEITGKLDKGIEYDIYRSFIDNAIYEHTKYVGIKLDIRYEDEQTLNAFAKASHEWVSTITKLRK